MHTCIHAQQVSVLVWGSLTLTQQDGNYEYESVSTGFKDDECVSSKGLWMQV